MIKTKSILAKKGEDDNMRICVMRFVKKFYNYDKWLRVLAPSIELLNDYRNNQIKWNEFESRYIKEMESNEDLIKELKIRSDNGEIITLLCREKNDDYCHRRLLKELIESKCELIKTKASIGKVDHIFPKLTEKNFFILADKITEIIDDINRISDDLESVSGQLVHHGWDED